MGTINTGLQEIGIRDLNKVPTVLLKKAADIIEEFDFSVMYNEDDDHWFALDDYTDLNIYQDENGQVWATFYEFMRARKNRTYNANNWCLLSVLLGQNEVSQ